MNRTWLVIALFLFVVVPALAQAPPEAARTANALPAAEAGSRDAAGTSLPAGVTADWWAQAQREIRDSEYFVTWQDATVLLDLPAAWQAPNRAHNFRSYFTERGIRIVRRTETTPTWEWGLALLGVGRGDQRTDATAASLSAERNRIEFDRGSVREWFVNSSDGIEQGFAVADRPSADGAGGAPFYIDLALTGDLRPVLAEDNQAVTFFAPGGEAVLTYARLVARDDRGRPLPSHMEAHTDGELRVIRLVVDDADAVYPIAIDPVATNPVWSGESNQAYAHYGHSVSGVGDINGDGFGDFVVGAPHYDNGQTDEGRIYVYRGSASVPSLAGTWEPNVASTLFGFVVAAAGDINNDGCADFLVGAPDYATATTTGGRVFLFQGSIAAPYFSNTWVHDGVAAGDQYGWSVSTAGDVDGDNFSDIVVGSPGYDRYYNGNWFYDAGKVYVYHGSLSGLPADADGAVSGGAQGDKLGTSVATAGDVDGDGYSDIVVGIPYYDSGGLTDIGRVQVFRGGVSGIGIEPAAYWSQNGEVAGSGFALVVGPAGDVDGNGYSDIIVGAKYYTGTFSGEGKVYVYYGPTLSSPAPWTKTGGQTSAFLGQSVGLAGDVNGDGYADVIVGAYGYTNDLTKEGRAYVYCGSSTGVNASPCWTGEGNLANADFGNSVGPAGDVNGDGYSDIIVGAWRWTNGSTEEGAAFVYLGGPDGIAANSSWSPGYGTKATTAGDVNGDNVADILVYQLSGARVYPGSPSGPGSGYYGTFTGDESSFGHAAAAAGDVNGDGYDDIIVGEHLFDTGNIDAGKVFVFHGSVSGMDTTPDWTATGGYAYIWFGFSVASAGDRNGDGYGDVVIGAPRQDNQRGWVYVANGSATGLGAPTFLASGTAQQDCFGYAVANAGDIDRDGKSDIVIGAPQYDCAESNPHYDGYVKICYGGRSCVSGPSDCVTVSAQLGHSVAGAGDVNGDGYADVILGAPGYNSGVGRACVYHGSSTGLPEAASRILSKSLHFGDTVSWAGDVNGDGYADVVVANDDHAFGFYGSATGLPASENWSVAGGGGWVAPAGDVNGDGFADVLVGTSLYYGGGGRGVSFRPRQLKTTNAVLAQLGMSNHPKNFNMAILGATFLGRGPVRMQMQAQPLGVAWPAGRVDTNDYEATPGGVLLVGTFPGEQMSLYHWRVRLGYQPTHLPWQRFGRWMTTPWQGWLQTDLRTFTGDYDGDGRSAANDCDDTNNSLWADPSEARSLHWDSKTMLNWTAPADPGGAQLLSYDTLRSTVASDFLSATCIEQYGNDLFTSEPGQPNAGQVYFYLVRADNGCPGYGSLGAGSNGVPRAGTTCEE